MRLMRARLMMSVVTLGIMVALTAIGLRSCSGAARNSPLNPVNVLSNGLGGVCADEQAAAAGLSGGSSQTIRLPPSAASLGPLAGAAGISGGTYTCPTTTTAPG